ncbi:MAG: HU family DNA-binding protein [Planctomycetota bacterium]|jgi:integration host factor subunit beta
MATTTKKDLIDWIADETGQKRTTVKRTVQSFLDKVIDELSHGNRLEFRDFGVFEIRDRAPRVAQNPKTLERVPVPAKRTVKFKVGRLMKVALENNAGADLVKHKDGVVPRTARVPVASSASAS